MRYHVVRGIWERAATLAALILIVSGCSLLQGQSQASPSESPASSPTGSPPATPSASQLAITNADFHPGEVGFTYSPALQLAAMGGTAPYTWSVAAGAIPTGLTFTQNGSVYGDPTAAGTFHFTVQVADSAGATATAARSVAIAPRLQATLIRACARACSVEVGCVTVCGNFGTVSGGAGPFTYTLQAGGYVPAGTTVSTSSLSLTGTFTAVAKYWQFTVLVRDSSGGAASITPTFYVFPHLSLASGTCSGDYSTGCTVKLKISGGAPGVTPTVRITSNVPNSQGCYNSGPPPQGYRLTVAAGYVTVSIPANIGSGYGAIWTLVLTDKSRCSASSYCTSAPASVSIKVICS